mmetsp:Transcript_21743/g.53224  ORF Transcript_21743/g.53224 Transcript_21743/m.53224 type:complete len:175 (+) Transcript_21743:62-586(+)
MRFKNRYLFFIVEFEDHPPKNMNGQLLIRAIRKSVVENFGDFGYAKVQKSLSVRFYSGLTHSFILKMPRDFHRMVWAAVSFITMLSQKRVRIRSLAMSGTLSKCGKTARFWIRNTVQQTLLTDDTNQSSMIIEGDDLQSNPKRASIKAVAEAKYNSKIKDQLLREEVGLSEMNG